MCCKKKHQAIVAIPLNKIGSVNAWKAITQKSCINVKGAVNNAGKKSISDGVI